MKRFTSLPFLAGVKVLEVAGLAPVPFAGMLLSDYGADVIRVDQPGGGGPPDLLARGKRSIAIDLKHPDGRNIFLDLAAKADVLIEPYRPGVMERLLVGPQHVMPKNPKLVYVRLTGFGQSGPLAPRAGHDINYLAVSGVLSGLASKGNPPSPPINLLADFAGGGLMAAYAVASALLSVSRTGEGGVLDLSMTEGAAYVSTFLTNMREAGLWPFEPGMNLLDGGAPFYKCYKTKDGRFMAVGCIEGPFFEAMLRGLQMDVDKWKPLQMDLARWPELEAEIASIFLQKPMAAWSQVFDQEDACVTPVLDHEEAMSHPHNTFRETFVSAAKQTGNFEKNIGQDSLQCTSDEDAPRTVGACPSIQSGFRSAVSAAKPWQNSNSSEHEIPSLTDCYTLRSGLHTREIMDELGLAGEVGFVDDLLNRGVLGDKNSVAKKGARGRQDIPMPSKL